MTVVLIAAGWLLLVRERAALAAALDEDLQSRSELIAPSVRADGRGVAHLPTRLIDPDEEFAQVLNPSGRLMDVSAGFTRAPVVPATVLRGVEDTHYMGRDVPVLGSTQVAILPIRRGGRRFFLVIGESRREQAYALDHLLRLLFLVVPLGTIATTAIGWLLAGLALRPVEGMRQEADGISKGDLGRRLPVPSTGDELARLATTMNAMLDRVQAAVEHERGLVDFASHELRTPLGVARAEVDLALARPRSREELQDGLRTVGEELDWMTRLTDDLLVLAGVDQGGIRLRVLPTPIAEILEECVARYLEQAQEAGIELRTAAGDDITTVDADRLRQAIGNLLENALRHTAAGGWVAVRAEVDHEHVRVVVEDSGEGFPDDILEDAFEPFTTSHDGDRRGTGLGLAIVRAVAESHGGVAVAQNVPGGGARVTMVLPSAGPGAEGVDP
jgi:two-component system, OmpR family, sensor kinase